MFSKNISKNNKGRHNKAPPVATGVKTPKRVAVHADCRRRLYIVMSAAHYFLNSFDGKIIRTFRRQQKDGGKRAELLTKFFIGGKGFGFFDTEYEQCR